MKNRLKKKKIVLGITGGTACGKTTVASMFKKSGASCIDADSIYHRLISPGSAVYEKIVYAFGTGVLGKRSQIDRKKIAGIVFNNSQRLRRLCRITHPAIIRRIKEEVSRLRRAKRKTIIAVDAPLLIEAGLTNMFDKMLVVKANRKNQLIRGARLRGLSRQQLLQRIKAQTPQAEKIKLADYVIDNNGTLEQTKKQVREIRRQMVNPKREERWI